MKNLLKNSFFRFCRFGVRCLTPRYQVYHGADLVAPAVYVVHHQNLRGPIISMAWFNIPVRLWVLSIFCDRKSCFRQFYEFTFTKRLGLPKILAAIIVLPLSFCVPWLMQSMQAIPVFRGSKAIVKTFRHSISALVDGENLLICPDIDYTDPGTAMGEMYNGFLDLAKYYRQKTGKQLPFIPLHIGQNKHDIYVGKAIYFSPKADFKQEKSSVAHRLKQESSQLAQKDL